VEADRRRRRSSQNRATRRAERARRSKEIGQLPPEERKAAGASVRALAEEIAVAEAAGERGDGERRESGFPRPLPRAPDPPPPGGPGRTRREREPGRPHRRRAAPLRLRAAT